MTRGRAVVVGASHAGAQLCARLRQEGWDGEILLIGDEPYLPYQRPPMSKTYLAAKSEIEDLLIRGPEFYEKQKIKFRIGRVARIDRNDRCVVLSDGESIGYEKLALCLGARPRLLRLPGAELEGVHYLRTAGDVEAIRAPLADSSRVVIVGGGYIGLETAASLSKLGLQVTVLEAADRVLQRVTAPEVSGYFARIHQAEGVHVRTDATVAGLEGSDRVTAVRLADGEELVADIVIVGIGVQPNVELAQDAGLTVNDGIDIDAHSCTSDPDIVAAGDCANYHDPFYGRRVRLESVSSAVEQAKVAAATMCGRSDEIKALPWFWSDQYDLKLQIAGLNTGYDQVVFRGDPTMDREFASFYLRDGELIAADCVNRPQEFMFSKRAISHRLPVSPERLADLDIPIADQLKSSEAVGG
jgi:3-phenylpropionate/trans-cinnamate dioxygenase ferredoxin reductase subunit